MRTLPGVPHTVPPSPSYATSWADRCQLLLRLLGRSAVSSEPLEFQAMLDAASASARQAEQAKLEAESVTARTGSSTLRAALHRSCRQVAPGSIVAHCRDTSFCAALLLADNELRDVQLALIEAQQQVQTAIEGQADMQARFFEASEW